MATNILNNDAELQFFLRQNFLSCHNAVRVYLELISDIMYTLWRTLSGWQTTQVDLCGRKAGAEHPNSSLSKVDYTISTSKGSLSLHRK